MSKLAEFSLLFWVQHIMIVINRYSSLKIPVYLYMLRVPNIFK